MADVGRLQLDKQCSTVASACVQEAAQMRASGSLRNRQQHCQALPGSQITWEPIRQLQCGSLLLRTVSTADAQLQRRRKVG